MELKIYVIRDDVAGVCHLPFFMQNDNVALRAFSDALTDQNSQYSKHPADYRLFRIGVYDDGTGEIVYKGQELIVTGAGILKVEQGDLSDVPGFLQEQNS